MKDRIAAHNERVKLLSGLFNSLGIGLIVLSLLRPLTDDVASPSYIWAAIGLALHSISYYIVKYIRRKE
jgi:hypothetical protein